MNASRVLIINPSCGGLGGSEIMLRQFLASARHAGIETHTVFFEQDAQMDDLLALGHSCRHIPSGRLREALPWLRAQAALHRLFREFRPDVVIGWQAKAASYAALPAAMAGTPFFCFHRGQPGRGLIDRLSYLLPCAGFLSNSHFTRAKLAAFSRRNIAVVHSAVDLSLIEAARRTSPAQARQALGFDPARPLVGIVGRLQRWKGMHVFIDALALVVSRFPECQGVIVGPPHALEADYPDALTARLRERGMAGHIRMVGGQTNPAEWMQAMDVVVHASDEEPFGLVVAEAMALGKPVIATRPGGPVEMISHRESGLLVAFEDHAALADAIGEFLADPIFAQRCGENARATAVQWDGSLYASRVLEAIATLQKSPAR